MLPPVFLSRYLTEIGIPNRVILFNAEALILCLALFGKFEFPIQSPFSLIVRESK